MRRFLLLQLLILFALGQTTELAQEKQLENVTDRPESEALRREALDWLEAVRLGDRKALVKFALPEARPHLERELMDDKSLLSTMLLTGPIALRKCLNGQPARTVVLLRDRALVKYGEGTTVCYYRFDSLPNTLPGTMEELPDYKKPDQVFCTFWVRDQGRWYVGYSFAEEEDGA